MENNSLDANNLPSTQGGITPSVDPSQSRPRSASFKRPRSDDNFIEKTFDHFSAITGVMNVIKADLDKQSTSKNGSKNEKDKFLTPISNAFSELESKLTDLAGVVFELSKDHDNLKNSVFEIQNTIKSNKVSGDLVSSSEQSATYRNLCNEIAKSNVTSKVQKLDLGCAKTGTHSEMTEAVKSKLKEYQPLIPLKDVVITPLAKATVIENDKHLIPVLFKCKDRDHKFNLDTTLKANDLNPGFHWPKEMVPIVKDMRKKLGEVKNSELDLSNKQIMIRPTFSGKTLNISYRSKIGDQWTLLENVKVPAPKLFLEKTGFTQPCVSKYFKI